MKDIGKSASAKSPNALRATFVSFPDALRDHELLTSIRIAQSHEDFWIFALSRCRRIP